MDIIEIVTAENIKIVRVHNITLLFLIMEFCFLVFWISAIIADLAVRSLMS